VAVCTYSCEFNIKDRVIVDGDEGVKAVVTGVMFQYAGCSVQIGWFNNGSAMSAWVEDWRLTHADR
jgi:hypothetical protein